MCEYSDEIISLLKQRNSVSSADLSIPKEKLHGVLMALKSKDQINFEITEQVSQALTTEGEEVVKNGSYEFNLFRKIPDSGLELRDLDSEVDKIGQKHAFKNKWIRKEGSKIFRNAIEPKDEVVEMLSKLKGLDILDSRSFDLLKKRSLATSAKTNLYVITKGDKFNSSEHLETELTVDLINSFANHKFKIYNFDTYGSNPNSGSLHPLMKIKAEFKRIFLEMGFNEMATNQYVESSFWNFDSLFQPQNHPSRDSHDTFFLSRPETSDDFDMSYLEKVKTIHSEGGMGSTGYNSEWSIDEAKKNILRTHTTAISSRYLKAMASSYLNGGDKCTNLQDLDNLACKEFKPIKLFSIDKVFRNETVDATHMAEFHQVEGVIAGFDLGIGHLMGFLKEFFTKLGLSDIRFKPAFNPYTEPSMEIFGFHPGLNKWIEIGNSGIFRPEMLGPMGYPEDLTVLAWGLSVERPTMIKYGLNNIRDLVGHKVDLDFAKKSEFVFFN